MPTLPVIDQHLLDALPDLERYAAASTAFSHVVSIDSGLVGPHVVITALTHGNEVAGAIALDRLIRENPAISHGRLSLCFVNYRAYAQFDPAAPFGNRFLQCDMNRVWHGSLASDPTDAWEVRRARELLPLIESSDFLLDLHTMPRKAPPLALIGPAARHRDLARAMGWPKWVMIDPGHADGKRLTDYHHFSDPNRYASAMLIECGYHFDLRTADIAYRACRHLLKTLHMLDSPARVSPDPARIITVTHSLVPTTAAEFSFERRFDGLQVIEKAGTLIARDGSTEIRTPYDDCVLLMPALLPSDGATALRLGRAKEFPDQ